MKYRSFSYILFLIVGLGCLSSCKEENRGTQSVDGVPPGKVINPRVIREFGGGVTVQYDIPDDEDLLLVKAVYTLDNGEVKEASSSQYHNQLDIVGFSVESDKTVQLVSVDRSKNESEPVTITVRPKESPIHEVFRNLKVSGVFGGLRLDWQNPEKERIVVMVTRPTEPGSELYERVQDFFTSAADVTDYIWGLPAGNLPYRIQVRDRWGNFSEYREEQYNVLFAKELDKRLFRRWSEDPDIPFITTQAAYPIESVWDGLLNSGNNASIWVLTPQTSLPVRHTWDLGATYYISRITLWTRGGQYPYTEGPRYYSIYGSESAEARLANDDDESMLPNDPRKWKLILPDGEFVQPSGLGPGQRNPEDVQYASVTGQSHILEDEASVIPVRYIRFDMHQAWDNGFRWILAEISFFGQDVE